MNFGKIFALVALCIWPSVLAADERQREILVSGTGTIAAEPDMAVLSLGVTRESLLAKNAMADANREVAAVLTVLEASGVAGRDVQTSSLSLSPRWDHQQSNERPRIVGYVASNTLSIKVRDLDGLGDLLDKVVGSGANQMNGLTFAMSDPKPVQAEARALAVKDALSKATTLAEAAGVTLGSIRTISEGSANTAQPRFRAEAFAADAAIATGEIQTQITVNIVVAIAE